MSDIASSLARIRLVADRKGGLAELSRVADVPYSTVHSFAKRDWTNKHLDVLEKLAGAAEVITKRDTAA